MKKISLLFLSLITFTLSPYLSLRANPYSSEIKENLSEDDERNLKKLEYSLYLLKAISKNLKFPNTVYRLYLLTINEFYQKYTQAGVSKEKIKKWIPAIIECPILQELVLQGPLYRIQELPQDFADKVKEFLDYSEDEDLVSNELPSLLPYPTKWTEQGFYNLLSFLHMLP